MKTLILIAAVVLTGCAPRESLEGAEIVWQAKDGQQRVVRLGPCIKTQKWDDVMRDWYTTYTECDDQTSTP